MDQAQHLLARIETECEKVGLELNAKKTEVVIFNIPVHESLTTITLVHTWSFFQATVETVLLYGCEAWTLTPTLERSLNGCYTRMLRAALNSQHKVVAACTKLRAV